MNQMPHFQSQDTSSEWSDTKIFYSISLKILTNLFLSWKSATTIQAQYQSTPVTVIKYVQAVCYQDMYFFDILTLEMGPIGYPKYQNEITNLH